MSTPIRAKLTELQDNWRQLQGLSRARRDRLTAAYTTHKFRSDLKELEVWVLDTIKRMNSSELPATIAEAEAALELHHERKVISMFLFEFLFDYFTYFIFSFTSYILLAVLWFPLPDHLIPKLIVQEISYT